ncbi:hypothetical protein [Krasilnikovia sp. MM14-A1259]|uniref:hypothetical protein n=1 Tax=Krasilnikovia sp. MM14-A1259 TaxID=3373539 RepID=UPI003829022F
MPTLRERLQSALVPAMKARDAAAVAALRATLAAIENAAAITLTPSAEPPPDGSAFAKAHAGLGVTEATRRAQDEAEVERIVRAEIAERLTAADEYARLQRPDHAQRLRAEAGVLASHLDAA